MQFKQQHEWLPPSDLTCTCQSPASSKSLERAEISQGIGTHPEPGQPLITGDCVQGQERELRLAEAGASRPGHRVIPGVRWAVTLAQSPLANALLGLWEGPFFLHSLGFITK